MPERTQGVETPDSSPLTLLALVRAAYAAGHFAGRSQAARTLINVFETERPVETAAYQRALRRQSLRVVETAGR